MRIKWIFGWAKILNRFHSFIATTLYAQGVRCLYNKNAYWGEYLLGAAILFVFSWNFLTHFDGFFNINKCQNIIFCDIWRRTLWFHSTVTRKCPKMEKITFVQRITAIFPESTNDALEFSPIFGGLYYFHRFANRETPCICNLNKLSVTTDNFFSHKEPCICLHFFLITNRTKTVITKQMCDKMKFNEQPQNIIL